MSAPLPAAAGGTQVKGPSGADFVAFATANQTQLLSDYGWSNPPTATQLQDALNQLVYDTGPPAGLSEYAPVSRGLLALACYIAANS